jgi:predicted patatin/cPLA2 family phospholipase
MVAVVIQGGAMRSIYCLGAVRALAEDIHMGQVDSIHVASAGCVSGMVLASQITSSNSSTVSEMGEQLVGKLAGLRFIDQRRIRKVVDVDYLVGVTKEVTSVTVNGLKRHNLTFDVSLTNAASGSATHLDVSGCTSDGALYEALRATMAIPVLYPPKVTIKGVQYIDGGIADPLPVMRAFERQPKVVVAISNVAKGTLGEEAVGREAKILRYAPGISTRVRSLMLARNPLADMVDGLLDRSSFCGVRIIRISPSNVALLGHRLETDKGKLMALESLGYRDAVRAFEQARQVQSDA